MAANFGELPPWTQPLRAWQREAVERWARTRPVQTLAVVTPGGGKTLYAAAIAYGALREDLIEQVIVVVPSDHLRTQAALTFAAVGVQLDPTFSNTAPTIARDLLGAVVTYQQVDQAPEIFHGLIAGGHRRPRRTLVVLDEIHHAGEHESWGTGIRRAFAGAAHIVSLSGTPFRSDETPVAFVSYDADGRVVADTVYGYCEGLRDDVVRPLVFYRQGGEVEWTDADGARLRHTFDDALGERQSRQRLRAALRDSRWVGAVLGRAHAILASLRRTDPDAAGLIVAVNERHARWIANRMQQVLGIYPVVVTYVDAAAGDKIRQFRNGRAPWLVAVRMVSEGVDLPRARVLVYCSTILTQMFFLQMVGRVVRVRDALVTPAFVLFPDDPTLREWALAIEADVHTQRRIDPGLAHALDAIPGLDASPAPTVPRLEAADEGFTHAAEHAERGEIVGEASAAVIESLARRPTVAVVRVPAPLPPSLAPPPAATATGSPVGHLLDDVSVLRSEEKQCLRETCNGLAKEVAVRFRVDLRSVHGLLRRRDGGVSLGEATATQLRRRVRTMEIWLREGFFPR